MKQPQYNPKEALLRAKLLMNYDSKKTLTENIEEQMSASALAGKAALANLAAGGTAGAGGATTGTVSAALTSWPAAMSLIASPAAAGVTVLAAVGMALYWAYRNADNEDALAKTVQACKTGAMSAGDEKKLVQDSLLGKDEHIKISREIYAAIEGEGTWNDMLGLGTVGGLGTNEEQIFNAFERLSKGNAADVCGVVFEYTGPDFVDDLAEDLNEADLSKCIAALRTATSEYAGEGKVFPPGSMSTAWYRNRFSCLFKSIDTVVANSVDKDENGYTYIKVKGLKRADNTQRIYRVRGEDGAIISDDGRKTSNAKLECDGLKPKIITESKLRKVFITEQGIDDSRILFDDELLATDVEKWSTGKYVVTWDIWLRKFTCLRQKFPNATPKVDDDGFTYFENKQPADGKIYRMYSDGEIWTDTGDNTNKKWSCAPRGGKIIIESKLKKKISEQIDIDPPTGGGGGSGSGGGGTPPPRRDRERFCPNGFRACSGTYTKCCSSPKIAEAQTCLNLTPDGKWGPNTQAKLSSSYPQFANSFTDADISTICSGSSPSLKPDDVGGAVNQINALDTNF
jgi:hypothetical protein